jgi:hypothetical protein
MRIILVAEREELGTHVRHHFHPQGSELVHYTNPIKAMDNIDEIDPDVVLFSAVDYPRHWKTFLNFLRGTRARERAVFVLLTGEDLSYEEASKAQHLGVNGIVHENLKDKQEIGRLRELVVRYKNVNETRQDRRLVPGRADTVGFMFSHPETLQAVIGTVQDISASGLRFAPFQPAAVDDIRPKEILELCSLRLGQEVISPTCEVVRNEDTISVRFLQLNDAQRETINTYLTNRSQRELKQQSHAGGAAENPPHGVHTADEYG